MGRWILAERAEAETGESNHQLEARKVIRAEVAAAAGLCVELAGTATSGKLAVVLPQGGAWKSRGV